MRDELRKHGIETAFPAESNAIFLKVGEVGQERLGRYWSYFRWLTDSSLIRFMFAYNTPKEIVPMLVRDIVELRDQGRLDN
jgi:threonine aldolase